jgi:uncharacterized membrane protein YgaE (UPF0421/DUF939 family)
MLATQAAVAAALVATIQPPTDGFRFDRFLDSLSGAVIALLVNALLLPADPVAIVRRAARPLFEELAATLDDVAAALLERDRDLADGHRGGRRGHPPRGGRVGRAGGRVRSRYGSWRDG